MSNDLDGGWNETDTEVIVVSVPINVRVLEAADEDNTQTIIDLVVGQAARAAHDAIKERLG